MKAFVLLSGGIDSTTCLHIAVEEFPDVEGISINYGQRHSKEIEYAKLSCDGLGLPHHVLKIEGIVPTTMLTDGNAPIPDIPYSEIQGVSPTYVPFRNGLMLSAVSSYVAGQWDAATRNGPSPDIGEEWAIYFGAHAEDAQNWAYPDCTPEFIGAMANAIYVGTYRAVRLHTPLQWLTKREIIKRGTELAIDWRLTWSCYAGGAMHCGVCPTCRARRQGFTDAHITDPTEYAA